MTKEKIEELTEVYDTLIELGVVFYYGGENFQQGEITDIEFREDNVIKLELNDYEILEIHIDDFIENHSKEGNNYHTWHLSRGFDNLLSE